METTKNKRSNKVDRKPQKEKVLVTKEFTKASKPVGAFDQENTLNWDITICVYNSSPYDDERYLDDINLLKENVFLEGIHVYYPHQYECIKKIFEKFDIPHSWCKNFYCGVNSANRYQIISLFDELIDQKITFNVHYSNSRDVIKYTWE